MYDPRANHFLCIGLSAAAAGAAASLVAPGLAAAGLIAGGLAGHLAFQRHRARLARLADPSRCPHCGYPTEGLEPGSPCPECGRDHPGAPKTRSG